MEEARETHWGPKLWDELRGADPEKVCQRSKATYDPAGFYSLEALNTTVRIYPGEERFESDSGLLAESADFQLLAVSYLLYAKNMDPTGNWVSEKDLSGGSTFFRGPHAMPSAPLEQKFGDDPDSFRKKSLAIGGAAVEYGDVAMEFPILPRISMIIVLWVEDEEFPARVTFMLDSSVESHFALDIVYAMTASITHELLRD